MFSYFAYGLGIYSTFPLPEFTPVEATCDVTINIIRNKNIQSELDELENLEKPWRCNQIGDEIIFIVKKVGIFQVRQAREVTITSLPDVDERVISLYISGTIMAFLSYQRGLITLHASAVDVNGSVVAFVGESGAGKSSTAAAMQARGHAIITDDVLPIKPDGNSALVYPAFPQLKLSPEVAASLGHDVESLLVLHPQLHKLGHRVADNFSHTNLPIQSIYVLAEGDKLMVEPLSPQQALIELVHYSYGVRTLQQIVNSRAYFSQCIELLKKVNVYRLYRPLALSSLPDFAAFIEDHALNHNLLTMV
jgi:HPr Serine kinase C-terminal domain